MLILLLAGYAAFFRPPRPQLLTIAPLSYVRSNRCPRSKQLVRQRSFDTRPFIKMCAKLDNTHSKVKRPVRNVTLCHWMHSITKNPIPLPFIFHAFGDGTHTQVSVRLESPTYITPFKLHTSNFTLQSTGVGPLPLASVRLESPTYMPPSNFTLQTSHFNPSVLDRCLSLPSG